jgi:16S rRNA (adenine1518-N6/adenine1519-N6)-dimethyltransferase
MCASPGNKDYGVLSVYCHAYLQTSLLMTIPPECFYPKPKVDSALIIMTPINKNRGWNDKDEIIFRQVLRTSFSKRRKTLHNCLKSLIVQNKINPDIFKIESSKEGIDLKRRAETLSVEEFYKLASIITKCQTRQKLERP